MKMHKDFMGRYLRHAPAALAFERVTECRIMAQQKFERPVLDIGCGDGIFAHVLFAEKIDTGIDPDRSELERATRLAGYLEYIACPGNKIDKPNRAFKTILSNSVLEHIPDLDPVLREAYRVLDHGGRMYVTLPTDRLETNGIVGRALRGLGMKGLAERFGAFHNRFWQHYNFHAPKRWRERFEAAGFTVVEERVYGSPNFTSFYDLLVLFAFPALFARKIYSRWFFFPVLRPPVASVLVKILRPIHRRLEEGSGSSLVFYALEKK
jgi:ubiquinone/menaquinone biosynthesis C-methylase UbiE